MSDIVRKHYNQNAEYEWERLNNPYSNVEFKSTLYLIDKYFPKDGEACDIGARPGRYSIELLKRGFKTTVLDISQEELNIAKKRITELGFKAQKYICEDALNLDVLEEDKYDVVLLMGPMYHILDRENRMNILKQVYRILKKDGVAIIAYINSWGVLKSAITECPAEIFKDIQKIYDELEEQTLDSETGFTECYFTIPPKALKEVEQSGLNIISYAGAESFISGIEREMYRLYDEDREIYNNLVKTASEFCELPQYRDAAEHLHIIVRK